MPDYKILPNSLEAEQALLGCILLDNEIQQDILTKVQPEDFYADSHKNIYKSMQTIFMKGIPVDFVTLTSQLEVEKKLEAVGGIDYITFLTNGVPSAANFEHYLEIVKDTSVKRHLIAKSQEIIQNTFDNAEDGTEAMRFAERAIFDLSQKDVKNDLEHVGKPGGTMANVLKMISDLAENKGMMRGIPTGYKEFDAITNGLQNSDLIVLAARPGVGKTSFAMNIAVNAALNHGKKIAVFSLEMAREQLMARSLSSVSKVPLEKILRGNLDSEEWKRVWTAEKKLSAAGIFIDPTGDISPYEVRTKCQKLKLTDGLDMVVIDYLTLMSAGKSDKNESARFENRNQEVTKITKTLKQMAKELNVPVLLLAQLNRGPDLRPDHRPIIADLRESGSIEQDADIVLFLYNPAKYNDVTTEDEPGTVYLNVAKHRNGSTGEIKLKWVGEYTTYLNMGEKVKTESTESVQI